MVHELFGKWKVWQLLAIVAALIVTVTTLALAGPLAVRNP